MPGEVHHVFLKVQPLDYLICTRGYGEKLEDKLMGTDITVVRLDFYILETLKKEMSMLGYLLMEEENARKYLEWYEEYVDEIDERVSGVINDSIIFAPQLPVGLAYIARWFYPKLFADLDVDAMHQEYMNKVIIVLLTI